MSEEKEEKSTWDELVGELGVNVTDDALERRQPPPKELPTRRRENVEQEQATPSDWEGLASSLGIDVPPVVEDPPTIKKPAVSHTEKPAHAPPRPESKSRVEEPKAEADVDTQRVDSSEFVEQIDDSDEGANESPSISGEAARSAFDALFAADAASWGSAFVSARTNVESSFLFTEGEEAVFTEDISDDSGDKDEEEEEKNKGRRRRRRGGRGRGRGGAKTGAGSDEESKEDADREEQSESVGEKSADTDSDSSEEGAAPEKRRRRRRSRGRSSRSKDEKELTSEEEDSRIKQRVASQLGEDEEEEDDDDLEEDLLDDDDSPSTGGRRPSHRNLPTWDEAIGVIVDTNLAQRSKSPSRQNSGSSRSRGRGGRRHKKS